MFFYKIIIALEKFVYLGIFELGLQKM